MRYLTAEKFTGVSYVLLASLSSTAFATSHHTISVEEKVEKVEVRGVRNRLTGMGRLKDVIELTEIIDAESLRDSRAINLTEAMQNQPGVIVANECSMCGYKRIQLNGLKAEHTTILTDGLPTHTIVSGFYAVDSIAMTGVERIEIARGAGAALTAPEAIGGIVNVITIEKDHNTAIIDLSAGENGFYNVGLLGTLASGDKSVRSTFVYQKDKRDQFDGDNNGLSENPLLENETLTGRVSWDLSSSDNLVLRISRSAQEMFGGPILGDVVTDKKTAFDSIHLGQADALFINNDVREMFIGNPWQSTEWIEGDRVELSASWLHEFNNKLNATLSFSGVEHSQESFYEGFDYFAEDDMYFADLRFNYVFNYHHHFTFGMDSRNERLRSRSESGEQVNNDGDPDTGYVSDSFDYKVQGLYFQDSWLYNDDIDLKLALRLDRVEANFIDPAMPGTEIDEYILSPRIDLRVLHDDAWSSRISTGRGYRAPLSFFETDHGILDAAVGFSLQIEELERSVSWGYTLNYGTEHLNSSLTLSNTRIDNLSTLSETPEGVPLLTQLDGQAEVTSVDLTTAVPITDNLIMNLTAEQFWFNDIFKQSYAIATTEQQVNLSWDWEQENWDAKLSMTWVGSRNLTDYGYEGYNDSALTLPKTKRAPSFYWVDFRIEKALTPQTRLYIGANNLLDKNQAADYETPLFFTPDGNFDVSYIYNLLRGREFYAGVTFNF